MTWIFHRPVSSVLSASYMLLWVYCWVVWRVDHLLRCYTCMVIFSEYNPISIMQSPCNLDFILQ